MIVENMAASFPLVLNSRLLIAQDKLKFYGGKSNSMKAYRSLTRSLSKSCCQSGSWPSLGLSYTFCKSPERVWLPSSKVKSHVNEKRNVESHLGKRQNYLTSRKFSLRLRPRARFRLLSRRLKKLPIRSVLNDIGTFYLKNARRVTLSACISVVFGVCLLFLKLTAMPSPKVVPYSDLIASLHSGLVTKVMFEEGTRRIFYNTNSCTTKHTQISDAEVLVPVHEEVSGSTVDNDLVNKHAQVGGSNFAKKLKGRSSNPEWQFSTRKIDHDEGYLLTLMREKGASYASAPQSVLLSIRSLLITVLTLWVPLIPLMWLLYRQVTAANRPAKKRRSSNQLIDFDDVAGVDTAKTELMELVSCLQGATNYSKLGAKLPRGVLLVGPPGTGKTLLARAVAGEAGVPFFSVSASEFVELFVGRGASRIRDLFAVARKNAPSIIFIDELDAVGGKRGRSFNDERDQTLNQLLTEMDGFESDANVVVIAATNRPEALDQALCRPGRFSRKVFVGEPDEAGRKKILAIHFREVPIDEDVDLICNLVASLTQGFVGADLANIVNEAALLAARRGAACVSREDVMEAIERAKFGINDRQSGPTSIGKELGKLFPWMPSLKVGNDPRQSGPGGPLGYQTLS